MSSGVIGSYWGAHVRTTVCSTVQTASPVMYPAHASMASVARAVVPLRQCRGHMPQTCLRAKCSEGQTCLQQGSRHKQSRPARKVCSLSLSAHCTLITSLRLPLCSLGSVCPTKQGDATDAAAPATTLAPIGFTHPALTSGPSTEPELTPERSSPHPIVN